MFAYTTNGSTGVSSHNIIRKEFYSSMPNNFGFKSICLSLFSSDLNAFAQGFLGTQFSTAIFQVFSFFSIGILNAHKLFGSGIVIDEDWLETSVEQTVEY